MGGVTRELGDLGQPLCASVPTYIQGGGNDSSASPGQRRGPGAQQVLGVSCLIAQPLPSSPMTLRPHPGQDIFKENRAQRHTGYHIREYVRLTTPRPSLCCENGSTGSHTAVILSGPGPGEAPAMSTKEQVASVTAQRTCRVAAMPGAGLGGQPHATLQGGLQVSGSPSGPPAEPSGCRPRPTSPGLRKWSPLPPWQEASHALSIQRSFCEGGDTATVTFSLISIYHFF